MPSFDDFLKTLDARDFQKIAEDSASSAGSTESIMPNVSTSISF